jgi:hypothetical protein
MIKLAKYGIIQLTPNPERHELVNVGLLIQSCKGWDIKLLSDIGKLQHLNPNFPPTGMQSLEVMLRSSLGNLKSIEEFKSTISKIGGTCKLQEYIGQFGADSEQQYNKEVAWLFDELVAPPPYKKALSRESEVQSRLKTRLRKAFKQKDWIGKDLSDIEHHKIVEKFPIVENQGLYAEFAMKNGVIHVTETVDFNVKESSKRSKEIEAQAKTLIISAAKRHLGSDTKTYVIVSGAHRLAAGNSINLLRDHNAEVFSAENPEEMNKYYGKLELAMMQ